MGENLEVRFQNAHVDLVVLPANMEASPSHTVAVHLIQLQVSHFCMIQQTALPDRRFAHFRKIVCNKEISKCNAIFQVQCNSMLKQFYTFPLQIAHTVWKGARLAV